MTAPTNRLQSPLLKFCPTILIPRKSSLPVVKKQIGVRTNNTTYTNACTNTNIPNTTKIFYTYYENDHNKSYDRYQDETGQALFLSRREMTRQHIGLNYESRTVTLAFVHLFRLGALLPCLVSRARFSFLNTSRMVRQTLILILRNHQYVEMMPKIYCYYR